MSREGSPRDEVEEPQWPGPVPSWAVDFPLVLTMCGLAELYATDKLPTESLPPDGKSATYVAAKGGDADAAKRIVEHVIRPDAVAALAVQFPRAIVASVHAEEASGRNKLGIMYARAIGDVAELQVESELVQTNRVRHTGATARQRLVRRPTFAGPVRGGATYIIADDVVTSGSSLAALRHYIESRGGRVVLATTLAAAPARHGLNPIQLAITSPSVDAIRAKFPAAGVDAILENHGVAPPILHLTESEAQAVLGFRSVDALRSSLASARQAGHDSEI